MRRCLSTALWTLFSLFLSASESPQRADFIRSLEQAASRANLFELPSFEMKAALQVENVGKKLNGTYHLRWNGPDQWKEEITFPGYTEVQVGGKGTVSTLRTTDFVPLRVFQVHAALGFGPMVTADAGRTGSLVAFHLAPADAIKKVHSRKENGDKLTCAQIESEEGHSWDVCIDETTGTLFRGDLHQDRDFQTVAGKVFPRSMTIVEKGQTMAKVVITEIVSPAQFPSDAFVAPSGTTSRPGCMNPAPYRRTKSVPPTYPEDARTLHISGTVATDVMIGVNGVPRVRKVIESPNHSLEESALRALSQWRYQAATCDGTPIDMETVIQVNYAF